MEYTTITNAGIEVSKFAGGAMWGEQDDRNSIDAVHAALDSGYQEEGVGRRLLESWARMAPKDSPERVWVHDFIIPERGKAIPYWVYDLARNEGRVSVGVTHDTASFAVDAIRRWWKLMGGPVYRGATSLLITADAGGSIGPRVRLWKWELQRFANRTGLSIAVRHFPPGTSKWNKIEHRLFSHIAVNWRGKPLTSLAAILSLIASTTTKNGLRDRSRINRR